MDLDKGNITSIISLLFIVIAGYFGANEIVKDYLTSLAGPIAGIIIWYFTEKHNSNLISGETTCQCEYEYNCEEIEDE